jgi:hypothetical protein
VTAGETALHLWGHYPVVALAVVGVVAEALHHDEADQNEALVVVFFFSVQPYRAI